MKILKLFFSATFLLSFPSVVSALPEIAQEGYFTCTACHVSPGGGGMLTPYGRDFSAEKLSTWSYFREGEFMHGAPLPTSDLFLVGGDSRWVRYQKKTADTTSIKFWRMNTDLELGVHYKSYWVSGMIGTRPEGPIKDEENHTSPTLREFSARADLLDEHVIVRAGLFMPKFGLMLSDHTAYVRVANELYPDGQQLQAEATYQNDLLEFTLAGMVQQDSEEREGKSRSGLNVGAAVFLADRHRINLNVMSTSMDNDDIIHSVLSMGVSGVVSITNKIYGMFEIDRIAVTDKSESFNLSKEKLANFFNINYEVYKGIVPYFRYEFMDSDVTTKDTSTGRWGPGINWYPRPHLQTEFRYLSSIANAGRRRTDESDLVLHYYF